MGFSAIPLNTSRNQANTWTFTSPQDVMKLRKMSEALVAAKKRPVAATYGDTGQRAFIPVIVGRKIPIHRSNRVLRLPVLQRVRRCSCAEESIPAVLRPLRTPLLTL
jgi:hypothetical protein